MTASREAEFADYVAARVPSLRRLAVLLCQDWHRADDIVQNAITKTNSSLGQLGTGATALQNQLTFVQNLQDTLDIGIGNLVNANLGKESAQLTALQTKQQLGIQALSIANQSSSVLLSLFR